MKKVALQQLPIQHAQDKPLRQSRARSSRPTFVLKLFISVILSLVAGVFFAIAHVLYAYDPHLSSTDLNAQKVLGAYDVNTIAISLDKPLLASGEAKKETIVEEDLIDKTASEEAEITDDDTISGLLVDKLLATPVPTINLLNIPTVTPTPTAEPTPTRVPVVVPTSAMGQVAVPAGASVTNPVEEGLDAELLFSMVNNYRVSIGLPAFEKDQRLCDIAAGRGPALYNEIYGGYMHAGFRALNLPYWANENIIAIRSEEAAFNWWMNSPVHRASIVGNYRYSCTACYGRCCAQIFTNFEPK